MSSDEDKTSLLVRDSLGVLAGRIADELRSALDSVLNSLSLATALIPPDCVEAEELLSQAEKGPSEPGISRPSSSPSRIPPHRRGS